MQTFGKNFPAQRLEIIKRDLPVVKRRREPTIRQERETANLRIDAGRRGNLTDGVVVRDARIGRGAGLSRDGEPG